MLPKKVGDYGENIAEKYLVTKGFHIIGRNVYVTYGEIDLIAGKGNYLYFFEVKYSRTLIYPEVMFTNSKKTKFYRAVSLWTARNSINSYVRVKIGLITIHKLQRKFVIKTYMDTLY